MSGMGWNRKATHLLAAFRVVENADDVGIPNECSAIHRTAALRMNKARVTLPFHPQMILDAEKNEGMTCL